MGTEVTNKNNITIMYWNGGGCFHYRVRANPELQSLLNCSPEIFVYAETCYKKLSPSPLSGYDIIRHPAKMGSCRRGLAVLFKQKFRYCLSKQHASKKFDILWLKFKNETTEVIYCFFYAPGQSHPDGDRTTFYDELRSVYDRYNREAKIF